MRNAGRALALALALAGTRAAGAVPAFEAHSNKARELYGRGDLPGAASEFRKALGLKPADSNARISLAGILMTQGQMKDAEEEFLKGLRLLERKDNSLQSYCWSRLGDIALLRNDLETAKERYERSLRFNPKDANAQIGLGVYNERKEQWQESSTAYEAGLALEPGNKVALEGLRRVRARLRYSQDPGEVLAEMRLRKILPAGRDTWKSEEFQLLTEMRAAEEEGGVDFLKGRLGFLGPNVVETKDKAGNVRVYFVKEGYTLFKFHFTQAAIADLEKAGVKLKYLYYLEDDQSRPLFDENGRLSPGGEELYRRMRRGEAVQWKLPGQEIPGMQSKAPPGEQKEKDPQALALVNSGFVEIQEDEENWLLKATSCTEDELQTQYTLKIIPGPMKKPRYFIHQKDTLTAAVSKYRAEGPDTTLSGTAFFGSGGNKWCK